jgi:hypothetical protein
MRRRNGQKRWRRRDLVIIAPRTAKQKRVTAIADADARENWEKMIAWRDHLVKHRTLEAAYLEIIRRNIKFPHILMGQLVQAVLRNVLDDCGMPSCCVPPRCYFRPQKLVMQEGSVTAIDEETESLLDTRPPSPLIALLRLPATTEVDLFNDTTAGSYWERSDRFDVALDLTAGRRGLAGLGDVIMRWLSHLLAIDVAIEPLVARHGIGMLD